MEQNAIMLLLSPQDCNVHPFSATDFQEQAQGPKYSLT